MANRDTLLTENTRQAPEHYVRAFLLIQNDLLRPFEFIEPNDRILGRTLIEHTTFDPHVY